MKELLLAWRKAKPTAGAWRAGKKWLAAALGQRCRRRWGARVVSTRSGWDNARRRGLFQCFSVWRRVADWDNPRAGEPRRNYFEIRLGKAGETA